jgi:hypothetical protein
LTQTASVNFSDISPPSFRVTAKARTQGKGR